MTENEKIINGLSQWVEIADKEDFSLLSEKIKIAKEDFSDQLMIMVSGEFNAGKSTFINALLGEKVLTVDITPATAMITKLTYGDQKKVLGHFRDGSVKEYSLEWVEQLTAERSGSGEDIRQQLTYVEYQLPSELLKSYTLIDSPGLTALHEHHTAVTEGFMERNDAAIWLFNAMSVGTASEMSWLRRMAGLGVQVFGVVNGIDRLDEEEDLNDFLKFNERRLSPQIEKLYGVSAKEILQGKLENDLQMVEWGNGEAIDELFKDIGPIKQKKMESFFRKVQIPLQEFMSLLKEKKNSFSFIGNPAKWLLFQSYYYPSFMEDKEELKAKEKELAGQVREWKEFIKRSNGTYDGIDQILKKLHYPKHLTNTWKSGIGREISLHNELQKSLLEERTAILQAQEEISKKWIKIDSGLFKLRKKVSFSKQEESLNNKIKEWNRKIKDFNGQSGELQKSVNRFDHKIAKEIKEQLLPFKTEFDEAVIELNQTLETIGREHGEIDAAEIEELQRHLSNHQDFCDNVTPSLHVKGLVVRQTEAYKGSMSVLSEIEGLYAELEYDELLKQMHAVYSHEDLRPELEIPLFKIIHDSLFKKSSFSDLTNMVRMSKKEVHRNARTLGAWRTVIISAILLTFFHPTLSEIDWESKLEGLSGTASEIANSYEIEDSSGTFNEDVYSEDNYYIETYEEQDETEELGAEEELEPEQAPAPEELSYYADNQSLNNFMQEYRGAYMNDLNNGETENIPYYVNTESEVYRKLSDFVNSLWGTGVVYDFHETKIQFIDQVDTNLYKVSAEESFNLLAIDGLESYNERTKDYYVSATADNEFQIEDIVTIDQSTEIIYDPADEMTEETISLVTRDDVAEMMRAYYADLELAFNGYGFSYIEEYYVDDGAEYEPTKVYIDKALNENMQMINHELTIESIEEFDENHYLASIYFEDEYHYQDGAGDVKEVSADYLIEVTPEGFLEIEELLRLDILSETEF